MSNYVVSMIEVKNNDKWELLKISNHKNNTEYNHEFNDNYEFIDFLLNREKNLGYINTDLGVPDDVSQDFKKIYNEYGNNASIPSYFYLDDLIELSKKLHGEFIETVEKSAETYTLKDINWKLDRLLSNIGYHIYDETDDEELFNSYELKEKLDVLLMVIKESSRIQTLIYALYGDVKLKDIRIMWFIY